MRVLLVPTSTTLRGVKRFVPRAWSLAVALLGCASERPGVLAVAADVPVLGDAPPDVPADASVSADASLGADAGAPSACARSTALDDAPALSSPLLSEVSGVVESARRPGVFFVHNDSGDSARFFAIDDTGALRAEYRLTGARAVDWEDLAIGPCDEGTCLYLGDIGDNGLNRDDYRVIRVAEPEVPDAPAGAPIELAWTALPFRYPDARHNAESLVADPATGDLYVITKVERGLSDVFRFPRASHGAATQTLARVGSLPLPPSAGVLVTGASVSPGGRALLVRTYLKLYLYERGETDPFAALFAATPQEVAVRAERQGEAVTWRRDGRGYVTVSEGVGARLNRYRCDDP